MWSNTPNRNDMSLSRPPSYRISRCDLTRRGSHACCRALPDHPVGTDADRLRDRDFKRLGGLEIDHQLDRARLLERQCRRFGALENPGDHVRSAAVQIREAHAIAQQSAGLGSEIVVEHRWEAMLQRQPRDELARRDKKP